MYKKINCQDEGRAKEREIIDWKVVTRSRVGDQLVEAPAIDMWWVKQSLGIHYSLVECLLWSIWSIWGGG